MYAMPGHVPVSGARVCAASALASLRESTNEDGSFNPFTVQLMDKSLLLDAVLWPAGIEETCYTVKESPAPS